MSFGTRLKDLRNEHSLTQEEFAEKIFTDKRQISLYENDKILPSTETLINIAKTFNISVDYLLFDTVQKHKLISDSDFFQKLEELDKLTEKDRKILSDLINSLIDKNKIKELVMNF